MSLSISQPDLVWDRAQPEAIQRNEIHIVVRLAESIEEREQ